MAALAEINRVVLHGSLERFGGPFDIGIQSPAEAVHALCVMVKGFRAALSIGSYRVVYGPLDEGMDLGADQLHLRLGRGNQVHIVPAAEGSGRTGVGVGKILLGVALIAVAFLVPAGGLVIGAGAFGTATAGITITSGAVALFGVSMVLSGIATIFAPQQQQTGAKKRESFLLSGSVNSVGQGQPVPLCYGGPIRAGSTVISLSYSVADIPLDFNRKTADATSGTVEDPTTPAGSGRTGKNSGRTKTGNTDSVTGDPVGGDEFSGTYDSSGG